MRYPFYSVPVLLFHCRFVQRCPLSFLHSTSVTPLLACAIAGCALDHKEANISVTKFLSELIKTARHKDVSRQAHFCSTCRHSAVEFLQLSWKSQRIVDKSCYWKTLELVHSTHLMEHPSFFLSLQWHDILMTHFFCSNSVSYTHHY